MNGHEVACARDKALQHLKRLHGIRAQALRERGTSSLVVRLDGLLVSSRELAQWLGATEEQIERTGRF